MSYPIDPEADIKEFNDRFKSRKIYPDSHLDKGINNILDSHPTMTDEWDWYEVYELNDDGRRIRSMGIIEAVSGIHARIKMATKIGNIEIATTGFYDARKIEDMNLYIKKLELDIKTQEASLNKLKDALSKIKGGK